MTHPLARVPFLGQFVDERFLEHRRRASSLAGFSSLFVALGFFEYHLLHGGRWDWEMLTVMAVFAVVKIGAFTWQRVTR